METERPPVWLWPAALIPRLTLCVLAYRDPALTMRGDSLDYLALARNLWQHGEFSTSAVAPYAPQLLRTPGYPLFLAPLAAMFSSPQFAAALIQSLLGAATVYLGWKWMRPLGGRRGAAFGALFLALDPVTVLHTPLILTEALFCFFMVGAAMLTFAGIGAPTLGLAIASGALWSAAIFTRPVALYLPLTLAWVWRRNKPALAAFLLGVYLLPGAWTWRNLSQTGRPVFSSIGGRDALKYPGAGVEALRTGRPWEELQSELLAQVVADYPTEAARGDAYGNRAAMIIRAHPFLFVRHMATSALKLLFGTGLEMFLEWGKGLGDFQINPLFRAGISGSGTVALLRAHPALIPLQIAYLAALFALYGFGLVGLTRLWRGGRREGALFLGWSALFILALSSTQGYYRFRIPMIPFLAAAAAAGAARSRETDKTS